MAPIAAIAATAASTSISASISTSMATHSAAKTYPFLSPAAIAGFAACRYMSDFADGRAQILKARKSLTVRCSPACGSFPNLCKLSISASTQGSHQVLHTCSSKGKPLSHLSAGSNTMFGDQDGLLGGIPALPRQRKSMNAPKAAYKDNFFSFRYPVLTEKPEWWLRTLACVPYLIALKASDIGFYLQPFLYHYDKLENLIYFVPGGISRLPTWFSLFYCYISYFGFVTKKDWPHFFRFHLMMALLLETAVQLVWVTSNFFPLIHYNGTFGVQYWGCVGFAYIFILLQCIRSALAGQYAKIPFISDAAYIHTLFNIGGFQRPF